MCAQSATAAAEHDVTHKIECEQLSSSEDESVQARERSAPEQALFDLRLRLHWISAWLMCDIRPVMMVSMLGLSQAFVGDTGAAEKQPLYAHTSLQRPG